MDESEETSDRTDDLPPTARMDVQLVLSDSRIIVHSVRPDDTVASLVDLLRRNGHLMGVSEARVSSSGSLLADPDWRGRTMAELGVAHGSLVHLTPIRPQAVRVLEFAPDKNVSVMNKTVPMAASDASDLSVVLKKLREVSGRDVGESCVAYQVLSEYTREGRTRRSIKSFEPGTSRYQFVDTVDGQVETLGTRTRLLVSFLAAGSGLHAAPALAPVVVLHLSAEVLLADKDGEMRPTYCADLLFPTALLLLRGLRLRDAHGATLVLLLQLEGAEYVDVGSGQVFPSEEAAVGKSARVGGSWADLFILVGPHSVLPRLRVPKEKKVSVMTRAGWAVEVESRRVRGRETTNAEIGSVWAATWTKSLLQEAVTREMRI